MGNQIVDYSNGYTDINSVSYRGLPACSDSYSDMAGAARRLLTAGLASAIVAAAALLSGCAHVPEETYKPRVGQEGKDVIWVPSPPAVVERMRDIAKVTRDDVVMDLGSGDGRNVIAAARRGARAVGVEFNPELAAMSNRSAAREGLAGRASFVQGDMFAADISQASVLALFLLPDNLRRLVPKFVDMKPGSRIVVNYFGIDGWEADLTEEMKADCQPWCVIKLYIVPAKVGGKWQLAEGELEIEQSHQMLRGTLSAGGVKTDIANARMDGERIVFTVGNTEYTGRVNGERMQGQRAGGAGGVAGAWTATRARP